MKSKNFPFKVGDKEFEADVTFGGHIAAYKVKEIKMIGEREYLEVEHINGGVCGLFPSNFPKGSIVIIAREISSEKLE